MPVIMQSVTKLKYKNKYIEAYTPFEAEDADAEALTADGCHILRKVKSKKISADTKSKE